MAKLTKKEAQIRHFRRRMAQRYNMRVTPQDLKSIVKQIQDNDSDPVLAQTRTRTLHGVEVQGQRIIVVYDKKRGIPVTALPPGSIDKYFNGDDLDEFDG